MYSFGGFVEQKNVIYWRYFLQITSIGLSFLLLEIYKNVDPYFSMFSKETHNSIVKFHIVMQFLLLIFNIIQDVIDSEGTGNMLDEILGTHKGKLKNRPHENFKILAKVVLGISILMSLGHSTYNV